MIVYISVKLCFLFRRLGITNIQADFILILHITMSDASWCHHWEATNHSPERFHSPFLAGGMNFPPPSVMLNPWQFSSDTWTLISSIMSWLYLKKKIPFLNFALVSLNSHRLDIICSEQCLEICITSTSYVCLPLYYVLLIVFLNCSRFG